MQETAFLPYDAQFLRPANCCRSVKNFCLCIPPCTCTLAMKRNKKEIRAHIKIWPRLTKYFMLPLLFTLPEEPSAVPTEPGWAPEFPPFINLYRFESTSSGVFGFGLLELCVQDTVNIYVNEALSFEPQISIFRNTEFILRMQWTFNPLCSSVDFIHSRPAQRSVPRPHCSTRSVECRCHLDRMEISNHGVSI